MLWSFREENKQNQQRSAEAPPQERLPVIKCNCKAFINPMDIEKYNGTNEEGEEYGVVTAECKKCGKEYETSQWGEWEDWNEAYDCLTEYLKS